MVLHIRLSTQPNFLAGVGAGPTPEFIVKIRVRAASKSGSARLVGR